jgi:peptide/nickel transport system permease protein
LNRYIIRRILVIIPVFLGITLVNYVLLDILPGDPVDALIDPKLLDTWTDEMIEAKRASLGLDKPWAVRYAIWLKELVSGNMGYSYYTSQPVLAELGKRLGPTLKLQSVAFASAVILGIGLGVFSALKQYSFFDYLFTVLTYINVSVPSFFYALLVVYLFAVKWRLFPTSGLRTFGQPPSLLDELKHMVLPALCLSLGSWATLMRYCRTSMLEVMHEEYITVARAKGLAQRTVVVRHALRNALTPVITIVGMSVPYIISGSVLVEAVFGWPGMGLLTLTAVYRRDYPVMMGVSVLFSGLVLASNLISDLAYAWADPRVRFD